MTTAGGVSMAQLLIVLRSAGISMFVGAALFLLVKVTLYLSMDVVSNRGIECFSQPGVPSPKGYSPLKPNYIPFRLFLHIILTGCHAQRH